MKPVLRHSWNLAPRDAAALQANLRKRLETRDRLPAVIGRVAGVDVGLDRDGLARASVAVLTMPDLQLVEFAVAVGAVRFPYVPGLLSFREIPVVAKALARLRTAPDVILCDGQGYAHPRRFGFASHLGVVFDVPTVGVAKTRLIGEHAPAPDRRGASTPLVDGNEIIGAVLRTRVGVAPLYISIGHRVSLPTAIALVMACVTRYRLPETTRWAHRLASHPESALATARAHVAAHRREARRG
ncbi:MAG: deoxyribonuclease V [Pseudomonadota bacterium]